MDAVTQRRDARERIISWITKSIIHSMTKTKIGEPYGFDFKSIVLEIQSKYYCSKRTAIEYAEIGLYKAGISKEFLTGEVDKSQQKRLNFV